MIKEFVVKVTNEVLPNAFTLFEEEYSPEQELVRCKDCRRKGTYDCPIYAGALGGFVLPDDWFCADGERR